MKLTQEKNLYLDKEGKTFLRLSIILKKRIFNALKNSNSDSVIKFKEVLKNYRWKIINTKFLL